MLQGYDKHASSYVKQNILRVKIFIACTEKNSFFILSLFHFIHSKIKILFLGFNSVQIVPHFKLHNNLYIMISVIYNLNHKIN